MENGADVVVLSRSASGDNTISCDLEDLDTLRELVTKEIEENGNFHILVNNSGGPLLDQLLRLNLMTSKRHFSGTF